MILRVVLAFAATLALYLALAGTASATELAAGGAAAVLMAGFAASLHQDRPVALSWAAARRFVHAAAALPTDTARVGLTLARSILCPEAGAAVWQPFADADRGSQAAEVLGTCISPNGIVLEVEPGRMLVHRLAHRAAPA